MTITPQQFVATARQLGGAGNVYVLGATGPNSFDCSGLIYRTLVNLGLYNGRRFSTRDFIALSSHIVSPVSSPAVGDIVLWESHHIGIVTGPDTFYSAYSPARGILDTDISRFPGTPQYYRLDAYAPVILVGSHSGVPVPVTVTWLTPAPTPPAITTTAPTQEDEMRIISQPERGVWLLGAGFAHHFSPSEWSQFQQYPHGLTVTHIPAGGAGQVVFDMHRTIYTAQAHA